MNLLYKSTITGFTLSAVLSLMPIADMQAQTIQKEKMVRPSVQPVLQIISAKKITPTVIELLLSHNQKRLIDFYGDHIFRFFQDNSGTGFKDPEAKPEARILVENPRSTLKKLDLSETNQVVRIITEKIDVKIDKNTTLMQITDLSKNQIVTEDISAILDKENVSLSLKEHSDEYFYGGGVQNGRFSHKGKSIAIENQNSWTDGGVASPTPFFWSSNGYGLLWHTFKKGRYDFGAKEKGRLNLSHETNYLDVFFMINEKPASLLNDFYQLTGNPVLLPKFGFYQGHLNAYNRDFWQEDSKGILFEDGKRYKESQKDNGGIKESLNGEKNNYQFSARAVIDRYKTNDMPFGWLLPNDGYGAGYGQTETLDGNIQNLKSLGEYARKQGVEIGLWTQSDLHPKSGVSPLLQRDIIKEVKDAGVRVLKTDVAWVGAGYSFGLNGVTDVAKIMSDYGNNSRPFIISLDGWAGTQRYAGIWSGDQTGGVWEYIRFHIPTYLGSGLSGQPNITSDMDGIFGGRNVIVNARDFQWKAFTPMQLNMDGWGSNEKYPQALGEPITSINRNYLKLKSELMPYTYSIAREAVSGLPMIRAMFLEYPNAYTRGTATQYQFLYGPNFLIAPIYQSTRSDAQGNDIRNGIYLPEGEWVDYFNGQKYPGNRVLNNFDTPLWKLPVFVRNGAIIPIANPNNNVTEINKAMRSYEIYPSGKSSFTEYDDDGRTEQYRSGKGVSSLIESDVNQKNVAVIVIHPSIGNFDGFVKEKATSFKINVTQMPERMSAKIGKKRIKLTKAQSMDDFLAKENVYFYDATPDLNRFSTKGTDFEKVQVIKNPQLLLKLGLTDVSRNAVSLSIEGFKFEPVDQQLLSTGPLAGSPNGSVKPEDTEAYSLRPSWKKLTNADFYEIEFNGMLYTTIKDTSLLFDGLTAEKAYLFKLRGANKNGYSNWTEIKATTKSNPLEFAVQGITAETTVENQVGSGVDKLFDFDEGEMWHTKWGVNALPFDITIDLKAIYQLDKFHYLPRIGRGNGVLLKGKVFYSNDKLNWTEAGLFEWLNNDEIKGFDFVAHPSARYIKLAVNNGVGGFGSGRELYVFKVPGTAGYLPGDVNNDGVIDRNDFTSYTNYTGLRRGDADFEGYISNGDINKNGLIDAFDISVVTTQLDGGTVLKIAGLAGRLDVTTMKKEYEKGETIELIVKGKGLKAVNAFSFAMPYSAADYEFVGLTALNVKQMENLTYDRLHSNGTKVLYATFVNLGNKDTLNGNMDLFNLKLKAKRRLRFDLKAIDGILVDQGLNTVKF